MPRSTLHAHPDAGREGLRRVLVDGAPVLAVARGGDLHPIDGSLAELLGAGRERLHEAVDGALQRAPLMASAELLAPVDDQEVWAGGVTYAALGQRTREESRARDLYDQVYEAERPELFFKAPAARVRGRARRSAYPRRLGLGRAGARAGAGHRRRWRDRRLPDGNDVSSRSIEGENPLYLPQAKVYDDSLGLSGTIVLARDVPDPRSAAIELEIHRDGERIFAGGTSVSEMKRSFDELVAALYLELRFRRRGPLTGTGVVPPDELTL